MVGDPEVIDGTVARHTGQPEPRHFCKQSQWKTCWQRMVRRPVVSSMRSRHTGQVGNSTKFGVGGGKGLRWVDVTAGGVKGSWESSGKLVEGLFAAVALGVWKVMDLMNTTWQVSGWREERS